MALSVQQVAEVSQLVAEQGVEALIALPDPVLRLMYKGYNKDFDNKTYQSGATIYIRIDDQPLMPVQQTQMQIDPIVQSEIAATVLNWTTGWNVQTAFEALSIGGPQRLRERVTAPRTKQMAVQAALICYQALFQCPGFISSYAAGTPFKTATDFGFSRAALMNQQAHGNLYVACNPDDMANISGDLATRFNPQDDSAMAYVDGEVKRVGSQTIYESTLLPYFTNGTAVGTGSAGMALSANPASGATSISVSGGTANGTLLQGQIIYFPGVFEINPDTKAQLGNLRGFMVTQSTQLNGSGVGSISIFPPIVGPENPKMQTCSALPVSSPTQYVAVYGAASGVYRQMLFTRKNSSAFISVKQEELIKAENGMQDYEGVIVQTAASGDIFNRQNLGRLDLLATALNTQWRHQYRAFTARVA